MDDFSVFDCSSPIFFLLIEFRWTFSISLKILTNDIIIVFWLDVGYYNRNRPSGLLSFVPAFLISILTPLFLPFSSVSFSYFVIAVPMRECLGKHSCISSPFSKAILNGTCFYPTVQLQVHNVYSERKTRNSCAQVNLAFKLNYTWLLSREFLLFCSVLPFAHASSFQLL